MRNKSVNLKSSIADSFAEKYIFEMVSYIIQLEKELKILILAAVSDRLPYIS
jgi:hypothetical protein